MLNANSEIIASIYSYYVLKPYEIRKYKKEYVQIRKPRYRKEVNCPRIYS